MERVCRELRGRRAAAAAAAGEEEAQLRELLRVVESAEHRAEAVAALNEFTLEAQAASERGVEVPALLGRVSFTLGLLCAILALTDTLGARGGTDAHQLTGAVVAVGAGLLGGMLCYRIGHEAKQRQREYREQVRRLSKILQDRIPPDSSAVGSRG